MHLASLPDIDLPGAARFKPTKAEYERLAEAARRAYAALDRYRNADLSADCSKASAAIRDALASTPYCVDNRPDAPGAD